MRGHSLVYQQKVGVVLRPMLTIDAVADETLVANASKFVFTGRHACCVRRAEIRVASARGVWEARETVTVVTLKVTISLTTYYGTCMLHY